MVLPPKKHAPCSLRGGKVGRVAKRMRKPQFARQCFRADFVSSFDLSARYFLSLYPPFLNLPAKRLLFPKKKLTDLLTMKTFRHQVSLNFSDRERARPGSKS